ncbi:MAG: lactonase family protein [Candidatus Sulfotelmatobacter sp.]
MKQPTSILRTRLLLTCLISLTACGGSPAPFAKPEFLYATATNGANTVVSFSLQPDGRLTGTGNIPGPNIGVPVADPAGNYLYVSDTYYNDQVYGYSIDPTTGVLSNLPGSPFVFGTTSGTGILYGIAIDPLGRFLYYDHALSVGIGEAAINSSSGNLSSNSYLFVPATVQILGTAFDPEGKFLFAANRSDFSSDEVYVFSMDQTSGALTQVPQSPFTVISNSGPYGTAINPSGNLLYVALSNSISAQTSGIAAMTVDLNTGALSLVAGSPFSAGTGFQHLAVHSSGKFLYAILNTDNDVYAFAIDQGSGSLTPVGGSPFPTGGGPLSLAFDASGQFLLVGNFTDSSISVFKVDASNGKLSQVSGSPFAAGIPVGYLATAQGH